ncbi:MAG TPA: VOC family protein [Thermoanaerobaculia bacterium]|nr:VOC family protein [Thermoanaerobaculia bacterium]
MLQNIGSYAVVSKVNVSNLDSSVSWYEKNLDLKLNAAFNTPTWRQLNAPGIKQFAVGLNQGGATGTGGAALTFVVTDIKKARQELIDKGVDVGPIDEPGLGVLLAFFKDPDGNSLGLRQNPPNQPGPEEIGYQ